MRRFPVRLQAEEMDCGPTCLRMVAAHHGVEPTADCLREACRLSSEGVSLLDLRAAATALGFRTEAVRTTLAGLCSRATLPCVLHWRGCHFIVLYAIFRGRFRVADPARGRRTLSENELRRGWLQPGEKEGVLLTLEPTPRLASGALLAHRQVWGWRRLYQHLGRLAVVLTLFRQYLDRHGLPPQRVRVIQPRERDS